MVQVSTEGTKGGEKGRTRTEAPTSLQQQAICKDTGSGCLEDRLPDPGGGGYMDAG